MFISKWNKDFKYEVEVNPNHPTIEHLDSTGARVRNAGFREQEGYHKYYAVVYKANILTVPLAQMITSQHDEASITPFFRSTKRV